MLSERLMDWTHRLVRTHEVCRQALCLHTAPPGGEATYWYSTTKEHSLIRPSSSRQATLARMTDGPTRATLTTSAVDLCVETERERKKCHAGLGGFTFVRGTELSSPSLSGRV